MVELIVTEMTVAEMATPRPALTTSTAAPRAIAVELTPSIAIAISTTRVLVRIALTPYKLNRTSLTTASKLRGAI
jgi:hypothetical protein